MFRVPARHTRACPAEKAVFRAEESGQVHGRGKMQPLGCRAADAIDRCRMTNETDTPIAKPARVTRQKNIDTGFQLNASRTAAMSSFGSSDLTSFATPGGPLSEGVRGWYAPVGS